MGGTGPVLDQTEVWIWVSPTGWRYRAEATDWSQVGPQVRGEAALTAWEVLPPEARVRGPHSNALFGGRIVAGCETGAGF